MVLLPLFFPASLLPSCGILGLLGPIILQFTFFQLTIFPVVREREAVVEEVRGARAGVGGTRRRRRR